MVAEGPTNCAIAQAPFVTQRNCGRSPLASIYRRLAISSRSQPAGALARSVEGSEGVVFVPALSGLFAAVLA